MDFYFIQYGLEDDSKDFGKIEFFTNEGRMKKRAQIIESRLCHRVYRSGKINCEDVKEDKEDEPYVYDMENVIYDADDMSRSFEKNLKEENIKFIMVKEDGAKRKYRQYKFQKYNDQCKADDIFDIMFDT